MKNKQNPFKAIFTVILVIGGLLVLLRRFVEYMDQLDDDSFKWDDYKGASSSPHSSPETAKRDAQVPEVEVPTPKQSKRRGNKSTKKSSGLASKVSGLNERQSKIYDLISSRGEAVMPEIEEVVDGVSSRTLRRDMTKLEKLGLIVKRGKTKDSVYKLK